MPLDFLRSHHPARSIQKPLGVIPPLGGVPPTGAIGLVRILDELLVVGCALGQQVDQAQAPVTSSVPSLTRVMVYVRMK